MSLQETPSTATAAGSPAAQPSIWSSIREALRGSHQDFTTGSLNRAILLLAIPMVLEMVLESLFAVVDVFWVGRLGADAVATVGLTESLLSLVFAIGLGLSLSTTAMVARRIGEKDPEGAAVAGAQAIFLGFGVSVLVGVPCLIYAPELLRLMGASPAIVATGSGYARIALGGSGVLLFLFLNNAIFRGAGDAAIAMRLLWVSNIINLILDPCFIFGLGPFPKLGVTGAAVATFTGRSIGVLYQFYRLMRGTETDSYPAFAVARELGSVVAAGARLADGNFTVCDRAYQLDRTGPHHQRIWFSGAGGLYDCDSLADFCADAIVGIEQRRGHAGGAEFGREAAGTRADFRVAHGVLQHGVPGRGGRFLLDLRHPGGAVVYAGPGSGAARRNVPSNFELREYRVCVRDGDAAGV